MDQQRGILNLKYANCRYIINDDMSHAIYCFEPKERGAYCEKHAKICYRHTPKINLSKLALGSKK